MNDGYTAVISEADRAGRVIASYSGILFRLSQDDPADRICQDLGLAAASLRTDDIPDLDGLGKVLYIRSARERMKQISDEVETFRSQIGSSLTKLYMHRELLCSLRDGSAAQSDILSECKDMLSQQCEQASSQSEKALISHSIKDAILSQTVAQKNISLSESWLIRTDDLISGLTSFEAHMIPLWKTRYADAGLSYSCDDIKGCFETGNLFAEKLAEVIR